MAILPLLDTESSVWRHLRRWSGHVRLARREDRYRIQPSPPAQHSRRGV